MDGNQGPEELRSVLAMCGRALEDVTLPKSNVGRIELLRRVKELSFASATVKTRLEGGLVLSRVPTSPTHMGSSPMASDAVDRLLLAANNVIAFRDT
ncbi:hypothetical protein [Arthrobacter sp. Leaf69]|uniref:hypothetical protein n=1 Tax=Arthrobacter sp. Leaf69 TaxID=1736232 RepID=UPI0006FE31D3|nr:hypothetical protein [Arthrobacter sp. Leaf69]KQN85120.1 hypothetical protein ASE96_16335 [Arthrobacter sp. Leaf69]